MIYGKLFLILSFCLTSLSATAAIPSTEGLFRNGNNADVTSTLVTVNFRFIRDMSELIMEKTSEDSPANESELLEVKPIPLFVKFLLSVDKYDRVQVIQAIYSSGKMRSSSLLDVRYISNLKNKIKKSNERKALFYSLLSSFALNRSKEMSALLLSKSKVFKTNKQLLDPEKKALYEKYKRYLAVTKKDKSLLESMENPLNPKDIEAQKAVGIIKKRPFMQKDPAVSLEKNSGDFYWKVSLDVMEASFTSETFRLEKLSFGPPENALKMNFSDYILFDGTHELPKHMKIRSIDEIVSIRALSLRHRGLGSKTMTQKYRKILKDMPKKSEGAPLWETFLIQ